MSKKPLKIYSSYTRAVDAHPGKIILQVGRRAFLVGDFDDLGESQTYNYSPNPHGEIHTITKRLNGQWISQCQSLRSGQRWYVGVRQEYRDPSF